MKNTLIKKMQIWYKCK